MERRVRSLVRWNAIAMILRANKESSELGGHIASFQSAALLYEIGFNHFWRAPSDEHGGDLVYIQGHSSPGIYARAFLEGRLSEEELDGFRQEVSKRGRALVVPPPVAHAGLLAVPDGLDGPGADHGHLPGALRPLPRGSRPRRDQGPEDLVLPRRRRDGRAGVARRDRPGGPREALEPRLRRQLQPAAPRRPGPRQRQDHPGARDDLPRRGLERDQGGLGRSLGPAPCRGSRTASSSGAWRKRSTASTRPTRRATARMCARSSSAPTTSLPTASRT